MKRYYKLRLQEGSGIRRLYRSGEKKAVDRSEKKGNATTCFKSHRGGEKVKIMKDNSMRKEDGKIRGRLEVGITGLEQTGKIRKRRKVGPTF